MIGQRALFNRLNNYNIDNFPISNLLLGEFGCGKHSFVNYVCDLFNIEVVDISNDISIDFILNLYENTNLVSYIIDINKLSEKSRYINKENALLKFIEEPPLNSFIFVLSEYESQVIDTIKNRCVIWRFSSYTLDELKKFKKFDDDIIYSILNTPGKLINSNDESFYIDLFNLCDKIIEKISKANISNTLSLDRYLETYDLDLFLKTLRQVIYNKCCYVYTNKLFDEYCLINKFIEKSHQLGISKKQMFDNLLLELRCIND